MAHQCRYVDGNGERCQVTVAYDGGLHGDSHKLRGDRFLSDPPTHEACPDCKAGPGHPCHPACSSYWT